MVEHLQTVSQWEQLAKDADYSPAKMALLCNVSERHLQRLFKTHIRCTPSRWLRDLQCRLAKELISQGYSNKAAAMELKFASESHLCREFKKVFGTSPQTFAPSKKLKTEAQRLSKQAWSALKGPARLMRDL